MTTPFILNTGDISPSFFTRKIQGEPDDSLIDAQVDPTQPQVSGLSSVTDPLVPDRLTDERVGGFDPVLYDLRASSHLMRLLKALIGAAGVGGLRKQMAVNRMAAGSLNATSFLDLDSFWGALFRLQRLSDSERLPSDQNGIISPATYIADTDTWDWVSGADGSYRSKILQVAQGFAQGATYNGLMTVAEALLDTHVEIEESWVYADLIPPNSIPAPVNPNTWYIVTQLYTTYGALQGLSWGDAMGGTAPSGQTPIGNRGELTVRPKSVITSEERRIAQLVFDRIKPAGLLVTILDGDDGFTTEVDPLHLWSDSEEWQVISTVTANPSITNPDVVYPADGAGRPAFSQYSGERWSYNNGVASVRAYQMQDDQITNLDSDYQSVQFFDGQRHDYVPNEALLSGPSAEAARAASDGIMVAYPYSGTRA
jgi:hypothetical protein